MGINGITKEENKLSSSGRKKKSIKNKIKEKDDDVRCQRRSKSPTPSIGLDGKKQKNIATQTGCKKQKKTYSLING